MAKKDMERRHDDALAAVLPILTNDIRRLNTKLAGLRSGLASGNILHESIIAGLPGLLLAGMSTYEGNANQFGELKAEAEDMVDDLLDDLEDLDTLVDAVKNGTRKSERDTQNAAGAKADQVAAGVEAALDKAREARGKAKGAATAAKKLAAANPKLREARASFSEASKKLRQFDRDKGAASTKAEFADLANLLRDARAKIDLDLTHLNEAMELVV